MRRWSVTLVGAVAAAVTILPGAVSAADPSPAAPVNAGFEETDPQGQIVGWKPPASGFAFESVEGHSGRAGGLRRTAPSSAFASTSQRISAEPFRGRRVRLKGHLKAADGARAGLFLRVDMANGTTAFFDNMLERPAEHPDWRAYEIEAYVPEAAETVVLGLVLISGPEAFVDEVSVEAVDNSPTAPAPEARAYLDAALKLMRDNHINSGQADWAAIQREVDRAVAGARTPADTYSAIQTAIGLLGEKHTYFSPPQPPRPAAPAGAAPASRRSFNTPPTGARLGRIGLVRLPALSTNNEEEIAFGEVYTRTVHGLLLAHDQAGVCGWIVDLRDNGGGNMWPMLAGLSPLLDEGPFGAFVDPKGVRTRWVREKGGIVISGVGMKSERGPALTAATAPVAVLLGPRTASSGEMTAIAFRGRPGVRFFGQPTAGFTTANQSYALSDGATLILTTAFIEDRDGVGFKGVMTPDEAADVAQADEAAVAWLKSKGCA